MSNTNSLTPHLWELYNFIKENTDNGHSLTIKEIADKFPDIYRFVDASGNHSNCPLIYRDIDKINGSAEIEKIIIKDRNKIRLATKDEAVKEMSRLASRAVKLWTKYWGMHSKIYADGQGKIISCQDTPIDENSKARPFVESFINGK